MTYHPNDFDRRVFVAAECALDDRPKDGTEYPRDQDVLAHLKDSSVTLEQVRGSLRDLGGDYLDVVVRDDGPYTVHGVENPLP